MKPQTIPFVAVLLCLLFSHNLFSQTAKVQIIHNSADVAASTVDIYLDNGATPAIDDFDFREATAFIDLPTNVSVGIAPGTSTGPGDIIATFPFSLTANETYVVIATGVLDPNNYDSVANGATAIAFDLKVLTPADTTTMMGSVALAAAHGATDVGSVDVLANQGLLVDDLPYGVPVGYLQVPATEYVLDVTPFNDNSTIVASYYVDLSPLSGGAAVVFASGFLDPTMNQNGEAFGLFAALPDGTVLQLTEIGSSRAQVIHNAADPGAATVDVYVNTTRDTVKIDDFDFREATPFIDLPTGYELDIVIAGPTSTDITDQVVTTIPATLMDGESYTIVANGVLDPNAFSANPDGIATGFELLVGAGALEAGANANNVDIRALHGATDAPTVDVLANGGVLVDDAAYTDLTGYLSVPAAEYVLEVTPGNDNSTIVAGYHVDLSPLGGGAAVVFASGFLNPMMNQNGEAFGLFAALPDGTVLPLTAIGASRAQVIHNAADPGAATVDVYVNTTKDTVKIDDFNFREATPFIDLPTGYEIDIVIAGPTSTDITDQVVTTIPATLMDGESYTIVANGVLDPNAFSANPDGIATGFELLVGAGALEAGANASNVDIRALHGATDAPTVDVLANGGVLVDDAAYTDLTGYLSVPAAEYVLEVTPGNDNSTVVAGYHVDLSPLGGGAAVVFASGFLDPASNQNGEAFGLFAALTDGSVIGLTLIGESRAQVVHNSADPAAATVDVYVNTVKDTIKLDDFNFRDATPFIDLPTGYEIDIVIAGPMSADITDQVVTTIPATLMDGESYSIIANGVLDPTAFAANPDGIMTDFNLFVGTAAQEAAVNAGDVDVRVFHGSTDAPTVDVLANGGTPPVVSNLAYTDFTAGYLALAPAVYDLSVTPAGMNSTIVATYTADVAALAGGAGLIIASGFLDPSMNKQGPAFGLYLVLPDGSVTPLPLATGLNDLSERNELLTIAPNPASNSVNISYLPEVAGRVELQMLDLSGRTIFQRSFEGRSLERQEMTLPLDQISTGIYSILVTTPTSRSVQRLVVNK